MRKKFINTLPGEINNLPSMTEPNQSWSIRQIINRHINGSPIPNLARSGGYYDPVPDRTRHPSYSMEDASTDLRRSKAHIDSLQKDVPNDPPADLVSNNPPSVSD